MTATQVDWDVQTQDPKSFGDAYRVNYNTRMKMLLDVLSAASKGLRVIDPPTRARTMQN